MTSLSDAIAAGCAARGLRMTDQRRVILRVLADADDHPDADRVHGRCTAIDARVSLSTVYRTLKLLVAAGLIQAHVFDDHKTRYDVPRRPHAHLIDCATGRVVDFESAELERLQSELASRLGYRLVGCRLELYGVRLAAGGEAERSQDVG